MSPRINLLDTALRGFPRVSGDEPDTECLYALVIAFSPRERG